MTRSVGLRCRFIRFKCALQEGGNRPLLATAEPPPEHNKRDAKSHHAERDKKERNSVFLNARAPDRELDQRDRHVEYKERKPDDYECSHEWMHPELALDDSTAVGADKPPIEKRRELVAVITPLLKPEACLAKLSEDRLGAGMTTPRKREPLHIDASGQPSPTLFDWNLGAKSHRGSSGTQPAHD